MSEGTDSKLASKNTTNEQAPAAAAVKSGPPLILKLILAQLVNEKGEDSFDEIVQELKDHQLLQNIDERIMTKEEGKKMYDELLESEGLKRDDSVKSTSRKSKKTPHWTLKLAQSLYMAYTEELLQTIKNDEIEFIRVFNEIQEIQEGKWDEKLQSAEKGETIANQSLQEPV